jgi:hypothetical protein
MDTPEDKSRISVPVVVVVAALALVVAAVVLIDVVRQWPTEPRPLPVVQATLRPVAPPVASSFAQPQTATTEPATTRIASTAAPSVRPNVSHLPATLPAEHTVAGIPYGDFTLTGSGFQIDWFISKHNAFLDNQVLWDDVPAQLSGWQYTRVAFGGGQKIAITANRTTTVYAAIGADSLESVQDWNPVTGLYLSLNDARPTKMLILSRVVAADDRIQLPQNAPGGFLLLIPPTPGQKLTPPSATPAPVTMASVTTPPSFPSANVAATEPASPSPAEKLAAAKADLSRAQAKLAADLSTDAAYQNAVSAAGDAQATVQSLRNSSSASGTDLATASQQWITARNAVAAELRRARAGNSTIDADANAVQQAQAAVDTLSKAKSPP